MVPTGKICLVTNCKTQVYAHGNVCAKHRWRMKKFNSYDLPGYSGEPNYLDLPKLPEGITKICTIHGNLLFHECYERTYKGKPNYSCKKCVLNRNKINTVNIDDNEYEHMLREQNHCCAICGQKEITKRNKQFKKLAIDHCHQTGRIRGLLCQFCNTGIGYFRESLEILESAINYLKKSKT